MKRFAAIVLALCLVGAALAQSTFTIRRPVDGSTVREVVKVRIPKTGIPDSGYIAFYVNGKFLEAALPEIEGGDYVYELDTQKLGYPDGPMTLEARLLVDYGDKTVEQDRTSVNFTIDNRTSIKIPEEGLMLRYRLRDGVQRIYTLEQRQAVSYETQAQRFLNEGLEDIPSGTEKLRLLYAVDSTYSTPSGREALVRIQALPEKGKEYAFASPFGSDQLQQIDRTELAPFYVRMDSTGDVKFTAVAPFFGLEGTASETSPNAYYALLPLPILPNKPVKPGDVWQGAFLLGKADSAAMFESNQHVTRLPARGVLEGVEWRNGNPCAKLKYTVSIDLAEISRLMNQGSSAAGRSPMGGPPGMGGPIGSDPYGQGGMTSRTGMAGRGGAFGSTPTEEPQKVELSQTVWFALDLDTLAESLLDLKEESLVEVPISGGQTMGGFRGGDLGGPAGGPGGITGPATAPPGGMGGPAGMIEQYVPGSIRFDPHLGDDGLFRFFRSQQFAGAQGGFRGPGIGGPGGAAAPPGGGLSGPAGMGMYGPGGFPGGGFGGRGSFGTTAKQYRVVRLQIALKLEK